MLCPYCGKTTKDDALFCATCGHKIARCPSCNRVLRTNARFCGFGGTALPPELLLDLPAPMAAAVPLVAPQPRYVSNEAHPAGQTKERSRRPIILAVVLIVLLLIGIVVGVGLWQGWFSSDRSSDEEGALSVSAGEAADQSEAPEEGTLAAAASEPQPEDAVQSEAANEAEGNAAQSSEAAAEADVEAEQAEVPISERTYEIVASDLSWSEANEAAREAGGHLATITSEEEYDVLCTLADESGLKYLWLGAALTSDEMIWGEDGCWITGEAWGFDAWYPGEPSLADADGTQEFCLCLWNAAYDGADIGWTMNDQRDKLVEDFPSISGKVGYVIEFDDGYVE
ncbi:MAG: zinc ribbon domain-containing protein [Clostridiales bacterium]|nr:zinc ribbon domain-containing protein [Clostridiales bacterium]